MKAGVVQEITKWKFVHQLDRSKCVFDAMIVGSASTQFDQGVPEGVLSSDVKKINPKRSI